MFYVDYTQMRLSSMTAQRRFHTEDRIRTRMETHVTKSMKSNDVEYNLSQSNKIAPEDYYETLKPLLGDEPT